MFAEIASIAGPVLGGLLGADAASNASAAQGAATDRAIGEQRRQFDLTRSDLAPYRQLGSAATQRIGQLLGLPSQPQRSIDQIAGELRNSGRYTLSAPQQHNLSDLSPRDRLFGIVNQVIDPQPAPAAPRYDDAALMTEARRLFDAQSQAAPGVSAEEIMAMDPGYQFRLGEGMKGIDRQVGAMGLRNSGAALKALQRYGQDYASNEFGNVFNRLSGAAGTGQSATNAGAAYGANTANQIGSLYSGLGNARGAAAISGANAIGGALNQVGNYYGQQSVLDRILNRGGTGGWGGSTERGF
jgi:hypothetical protein